MLSTGSLSCYSFQESSPCSIPGSQTDNDFIDGTLIAIKPEGNDWNLNSSRFEYNKDAYTDFHKQLIQKEHIDELFIDDDDIIKDEWNQEYDPLTDIELIKAMYLYFVFTSPSVMYDKEAEITSVMAENDLLTNNINGNRWRPLG